MTMMKTCPICCAKAVKGAGTCYECYYRYSDQSIRNVAPARLAAINAGSPGSRLEKPIELSQLTK